MVIIDYCFFDKHNTNLETREGLKVQTRKLDVHIYYLDLEIIINNWLSTEKKN